jgi:uracil DNA glycosylase
MREDPIVEEMRASGLAFSAKHGNDPHRISRALREHQAASDRKVVNRDAKRLARKAGG